MPQSSQTRVYPSQTAPATSFRPKPGEPRFLDQVANACRVRHLAYRTEQAYVGGVKRFILFHNKRHPSEMGASEVREFLTHLARDRNVAASTQNQALNAVVFMFREVLRRPPGEFGWVALAAALCRQCVFGTSLVNSEEHGQPQAAARGTRRDDKLFPDPAGGGSDRRVTLAAALCRPCVFGTSPVN